MSAPFLSQEERLALQNFHNRSLPGTAYLRRVQILLLADDGFSQEAIAADVGVPITRVRQILRAFRRERLTLFPETLFSPPLFSTTDPIAEAGRIILAGQLPIAQSYLLDLETTTSVVAVHETRKTIRRLRTLLQLFAPYYENGLLASYRRRFRKFMRRLGRSRDTAVFLIKLDNYMAQGAEAGTLTSDELAALLAVRDYWQARLAAADKEVRRYLTKGSYQNLLEDFESFTQTRGEGVRASGDQIEPEKVGHIAPGLIYQKVAAVRAFDDYLNGASLERLHALRIRFKELRYTLESFQPVMGPSAEQAIETTRRLLIHLGDINDARFHLDMLANTSDPALATGVDLYRAAKIVELDGLVQSFSVLWDEFDCLAWRQQLSSAVVMM